MKLGLKHGFSILGDFLGKMVYFTNYSQGNFANGKNPCKFILMKILPNYSLNWQPKFVTIVIHYPF